MCPLHISSPSICSISLPHFLNLNINKYFKDKPPSFVFHREDKFNEYLLSKWQRYLTKLLLKSNWFDAKGEFLLLKRMPKCFAYSK